MKSKEICDKSMTFQDCEMAILRSAIDTAEKRTGKKLVDSPDVQKMIEVVENFIRLKNLICYGGISINALLPEQDKIYNKEIDLPDFDFFSTNALNDAKELADIFYEKGYTEVEAKAGAHYGTYKVFVNFLGVADITYIPPELFQALKKEAIRVNGILYTPPNYLKMSMYLELSRPDGDISRWEKVYKRLTLLNKYYPLTDLDCNKIDFQRQMSDEKNAEKIYDTVRETFVSQGVVFFGGYAISLYSHYMPKNLQKKLKKIADFDVLSEEPETTAQIVKERLNDIGIKCKIIKRPPVGEVIPEHYEIKVNKDDTIAFIYKPIACHSYNVLKIQGQNVKIATIDTMLSFYLAFLYTNRIYYKEFSDRIVCMARFLFDVQQKNRLEQKGLLKRFSIECYGHQETIEEMREHKSQKYKELKENPNDKEYEAWFLSYKPENEKKGKEEKIKKKEEDNKPPKPFKSSKNFKKSITKKNSTKMKNKKKNKSKRNRFTFWKNKSYKNKKSGLY